MHPVGSEQERRDERGIRERPLMIVVLVDFAEVHAEDACLELELGGQLVEEEEGLLDADLIGTPGREQAPLDRKLVSVLGEGQVEAREVEAREVPTSQLDRVESAVIVGGRHQGEIGAPGDVH
ncbi:hypothetical protein D3C86_667780 [compost metagenome]